MNIKLFLVVYTISMVSSIFQSEGLWISKESKKQRIFIGKEITREDFIKGYMDGSIIVLPDRNAKPQTFSKFDKDFYEKECSKQIQDGFALKIQELAIPPHSTHASENSFVFDMHHWFQPEVVSQY